MRQKLEHWLNQVWYGKTRPPAWLKALVPVYRLLFRLDRKLKTMRKPANLGGRTILVVGNLTVGGSGKTPLVIRLCRILQSAGLKPGVISRGYGRKSHDQVRLQAHSTAEQVGDEPLVIFQRSGAPLVVSADRCAAAQALFDEGVDVVIADDGLQHHRLPRSLEICVIDGEREFGNGELLPAGPLREPLERLNEVDYIVINGSESSNKDESRSVKMQLIPGLLYALRGEETWRVSQFSGCRVNAVAGIGNPQRFFKSLQNAGLHVSPHTFPDHHVYQEKDFAGMEPGLPTIMTEKDAVKCKQMNLENAWYLAIEASLPAAWESSLVARVRRDVADKAVKK
jgi:tetraacyldisaccharide 4'-kinase